MGQDWTSVRVTRTTMDWLIREAGRRTLASGKTCSAADVNEEAIAAYRRMVETSITAADAFATAFVAKEPAL